MIWSTLQSKYFIFGTPYFWFFPSILTLRSSYGDHIIYWCYWELKKKKKDTSNDQFMMPGTKWDFPGKVVAYVHPISNGKKWRIHGQECQMALLVYLSLGEKSWISRFIIKFPLYKLEYLFLLCLIFKSTVNI